MISQAIFEWSDYLHSPPNTKIDPMLKQIRENYFPDLALGIDLQIELDYPVAQSAYTNGAPSPQFARQLVNASAFGPSYMLIQLASKTSQETEGNDYDLVRVIKQIKEAEPYFRQLVWDPESSYIYAIDDAVTAALLRNNESQGLKVLRELPRPASSNWAFFQTVVLRWLILAAMKSHRTLAHRLNGYVQCHGISEKHAHRVCVLVKQHMAKAQWHPWTFPRCYRDLFYQLTGVTSTPKLNRELALVGTEFQVPYEKLGLPQGFESVVYADNPEQTFIWQ
ncbi:hypothetical protein H4R33_003195 [Dimargaris cristalligena]|nr:hypothetical protein H4R33_003195 [Dimargaris cristalligena]